MSGMNRPQGPIKRRAAFKATNQRVLIVCEGVKTEPGYFNELRDFYELTTASVYATGDCGSDPLSVVDYGVKLYKEERQKGDEYDFVFFVFDKDSHRTYGAAMERAKSLKPAGVFKAIPSVPCFEYWYLLHYQYTTQPFERAGAKSPADCLIGILKKHHWPDYTKAGKGVIRHLGGRLSDAITHSKRAIIECSKNQTDHPSTLVHELVEHLKSMNPLRKDATY